MDRRKFIGRTVLLTGTSFLLCQGDTLAAVQPLPTHFIGIGRGGCNAIDYLKKIMPSITLTKALGVDYDIKNGKSLFKGEPIGNILKPLVHSKSPLFIFYCLGGESNKADTLRFIKQLKQTERKFKLIVQFPFNFEGKRRYKRAIDFADQISLITPFKSVHANRNKERNMTLKDNFEFLNQQIVNLILEEVK